jgi:hypothetical protein
MRVVKPLITGLAAAMLLLASSGSDTVGKKEQGKETLHLLSQLEEPQGLFGERPHGCQEKKTLEGYKPQAD